MRSLALVNETTLLSPDDVARCVTAVQTQVTRDFAPTWGIDARLRAADTPADEEEVLFLFDDVLQAERRGDLCRLVHGRPHGFVFVRPCLETGDAWQVLVSHEVLEMLVDPLIHLSAEALYQSNCAFFALEVCDPVAGDEYEIDGLPLANFVLPTWFAARPLPDEALVDFLGRLAEPYTLSPGGHIDYCTEPGHWQTWFARRCPKQRRQPGAYSRRRRRLQRKTA